MISLSDSGINCVLLLYFNWPRYLAKLRHNLHFCIGRGVSLFLLAYDIDKQEGDSKSKCIKLKIHLNPSWKQQKLNDLAQ